MLKSREITRFLNKAKFNPKEDRVLGVLSDIATPQYCIECIATELNRMNRFDPSEEDLLMVVRLATIAGIKNDQNPQTS